MLFDLKILRKEAQFLDAQRKLLKPILDECREEKIIFSF